MKRRFQVKVHTANPLSLGAIVNYSAGLPESGEEKRKGLAANPFARAVPSDHLIE